MFTPRITLEDVFDALSERLSKVFDSLRGKGRLSDADIDNATQEIRIALLEADVALPVVKAFIHSVREKSRGAEVHKALNPGQQVIKIVHTELIGVLGGETRRLNLAKTPPTVILLAGLQGAGKTTLAGKLALHLRKAGHSPMLVAADLQRPNAVQQLQIVGEQANVAVYAPELGSGAGDPVKVARDSVALAARVNHDIVIVDTAGRLGVDADMMAQAVAIRDAVRPDEILFVVDAMIGADAVNTAKAFRDGVGFTGVVLSKLDGDARGGAALSVRYVTGQPIMFASTGEKLTDFDIFHPDRMASRILGMGDVLTLIEQAEEVFDREQQETITRKALGGQFTLEDFLEQMQAIRKMGPIGNIIKMLPGMGQLKGQLDQLDDTHIDRVTAMIRSMTPTERVDSRIINASRRKRIADGSGTTVTDVNQLLERFGQAQKMMKQMGGKLGGMPGMPAIPGMPGMGAGSGPSSRSAGGKNKSSKAKAKDKQRAKAKARAERRTSEGDVPSIDFSQLPKELGGQ